MCISSLLFLQFLKKLFFNVDKAWITSLSIKQNHKLHKMLHCFEGKFGPDDIKSSITMEMFNDFMLFSVNIP